MVSWSTSGGSIGGMLRKELTEGIASGAPKADAAVYDGIVGRLIVAGTVDANLITRIQYEIAYYHDDLSTGYNRDTGLTWGVGMTFVAGDFTAHPGKKLGVTLFVAPDSDFPAGTVPLPSQIVGAAHCFTQRTGDGISAAAADVGFGGHVDPSAFSPNTKYWALVIPTAFTTGASSSVANDIPIGVINTIGRAISIWTNRTPLAPTITSPADGALIPAGNTVPFSFQPNDPDALASSPGDYRPWSFADLSGVQVQYRVKPTAANPAPAWADVVIMDRPLPGHDPSEGRGWYIETADGGHGEEVILTLTDGAKDLRDNGTVPLRGGGGTPGPSEIIIPSGDGQIRMRTFDYGHALSTIRKTNAAVVGYGPLGTQGVRSPHSSHSEGPFVSTALLTPDLMPAVNTSPWSEILRISVVPQVPAAIPTKPINNNAIPEGTPVTLYWNYRNTHTPPYPQHRRKVQIRKVGEPTWNTLVSGNKADHFYALDGSVGNDAPPTPLDPPRTYLVDPSFETAGINDWHTTAPEGLDVTTITAVDGVYSLKQNFSDTFPATLYQIIYLNFASDIWFELDGWAFTGAGGISVGSVVAQIEFVDIANNVLSFYSDVLPVQANGWARFNLKDLPKPAGANRIVIALNFIDVNGIGYPSSGFVQPIIDNVQLYGGPHKSTDYDTGTDPADDQDPVPYVLEATTEYEWRVQVVDSAHVVSPWSDPARFWVVPAPMSGDVRPVPDNIAGGILGCGTYRVQVFRRGGKRYVGEIGQISYLDWARVRDDISDAKVVVSGWDIDCGALLADLQTWAYEIAILRDSGNGLIKPDRVWEGPISLLTYETDTVTIQAKDVAQYLYRRIIKQAMNDSGVGNGDTVTNRAARIIQNVMAPDDPNVLAYLNIVTSSVDALEYRSLPAWSRTAYEEIDDMAANAGLDYTAVGRSIVVWGTKNPLGLLPEFRDDNFGSPPIVSEYGSQFADRYAVTDGNGIYGEADRLDEFGNNTDYGLVEMLSSSWASDSQDDTGTLTEAGAASLKESFTQSAERGIADRFPPPVVVRLPDNTTLNANTELSIQQLVPGVIIPLRSTGTLRKVMSKQKLDSVKVVYTADKNGPKETISVTMSLFNEPELDDGGGE